MCSRLVPRPASAGAHRLVARFMGVTALAIEDGGPPLLVDPFFTRLRLPRLALRRISPDRPTIANALRCAGVAEASAVLVTHAHYDHAFDAPLVSIRTDADFVGSISSARVADGGGVPHSRIHVVESGDLIEVGPFLAEPFDTPHGFPTLFPGEVERPIVPPAHVSEYREGGSFSYLIRHPRLTVLVHPATNFRPGMYRRVRTDVVFLSVAVASLRSADFLRAYWREVVQETGARLVVAVHWDDFRVPLSPSLRVKDRRGMRRMCRFAAEHGIAFLVPPIFDPIDLEAAIHLPPPTEAQC